VDHALVLGWLLLNPYLSPGVRPLLLALAYYLWGPWGLGLLPPLLAASWVGGTALWRSYHYGDRLPTPSCLSPCPHALGSQLSGPLRRHPMADSLEQFTAYLQAQDRSAHTVAAYQRDVAAFFAWLSEQLGRGALASRPLLPVEVTPFDVQKYRDALVAAGRKPAGVNRALAALRVFFAWAVTTGQASTNPAGQVQGLKQGQRTPKALTASEVYRLQRQAAAQRQLAQAKAGGELTPTLVEALRDEALLNLLLYTGLRVSEAAALQVADVALNGRSGQVIIRSGKGRKYRTVPLH